MKSIIIDTEKEKLRGNRALIVITAEHVSGMTLYNDTANHHEFCLEIRTLTNTLLFRSRESTESGKREHLIKLASSIHHKVYGDKSLENFITSEKFGI